ncbi:MAG TPA: HU family DNA-binding protein, partial [Ruminococcaceae bacterium]|nr:HU family DNA-binding protein [Oscillospiraceae bacterium]
MTKAELISAIAEKTELSKKDSEKALNALTAVITDTLAKGDKIQLVG